MRLLGLFFISLFSMLTFTAASANLELAVCGNGVVEPGEDCDDGNTAPGDCCSPTCEFESAATECRPAAGVCDAPDNCDGAGACTPDAKLTSECRAVAGICDVNEFCDGVSDDCPADLFLPFGVLCRAPTWVCDWWRVCGGGGPDDCSTAIFPPPDTVCRYSAGPCDPEEFCDWGTCPPDIIFPAGTVCRAAAGGCDIAETCDGVAVECPADASTTECIDDDGCCPDGCSAAADNDCLQVPSLSWRGLALCFLILLAGGIVLLRRAARMRRT